jgi:hypothetical protein
MRRFRELLVISVVVVGCSSQDGAEPVVVDVDVAAVGSCQELCSVLDACRGAGSPSIIEKCLATCSPDHLCAATGCEPWTSCPHSDNACEAFCDLNGQCGAFNMLPYCSDGSRMIHSGPTDTTCPALCAWVAEDCLPNETGYLTTCLDACAQFDTSCPQVLVSYLRCVDDAGGQSALDCSAVEQGFVPACSTGFDCR